MRNSAAVTAAAFVAGFQVAKPGVSESDVCRVCAQTMIQRGAERPGFILATSGRGHYGMLSGKPTTRKLEEKEMLWDRHGSRC